MCKSNEGHLLPVEIVGRTEVWTEIAQLQDAGNPYLIALRQSCPSGASERIRLP
jgi:hypothetical protein